VRVRDDRRKSYHAWPSKNFAFDLVPEKSCEGARSWNLRSRVLPATVCHGLEADGVPPQFPARTTQRG